MSSEELLYTNKFISSEIPNINLNEQNRKKKKESFRTVYEKKYGLPSDLISNNQFENNIIADDLLNSNKFISSESQQNGMNQISNQSNQSSQSTNQSPNPFHNIWNTFYFVFREEREKNSLKDGLLQFVKR